MNSAAFKDWFDKLQPREQLLVSIAAVLLVITLIVTLAVRPIVSGMNDGQEAVADKRELLADIERVAERLGPQRGGNTAATGNTNQSLVVVVDRSTRSNGLAAYLKRNQPDGADSIRIRFESAPFDDIVKWLAQMKSQYGLVTTAANIDRSGLPGRVNCNLTIGRAGS